MTNVAGNKGAGKFRVRRCFSQRRRRGYGIHSPFAYSLIRHVFGPGKDIECRTADHEFSAEALSGLDLSRKTAGRIERLCRMCGCENIAVNHTAEELAAENESAPRTLFLVSAAAGIENVLSLKEKAAVGGGILCLVHPRKGRLWRESCRRIAEEHDGMGVESRDLMIIFTDRGLNKQHIKV